MTTQTTSSKGIWVLVPVLGSVLFIILYIIAAFLYPGGSLSGKTAVYYNWTENYWCNLLDDKAINGQVNSAKPVAMVAMLILCGSLSVFWILFPASVQLKKISTCHHSNCRNSLYDHCFFIATRLRLYYGLLLLQLL